MFSERSVFTALLCHIGHIRAEPTVRYVHSKLVTTSPPPITQHAERLRRDLSLNFSLRASGSNSAAHPASAVPLSGPPLTAQPRLVRELTDSLSSYLHSLYGVLRTYIRTRLSQRNLPSTYSATRGVAGGLRPPLCSPPLCSDLFRPCSEHGDPRTRS